jgi:hypothetical protein
MVNTILFALVGKSQKTKKKQKSAIDLLFLFPSHIFYSLPTFFGSVIIGTKHFSSRSTRQASHTSQASDEETHSDRKLMNFILGFGFELLRVEMLCFV